ncbi:XRE family transcriptional regulator [Leifsonia sp. 115AMFTsu3.1]|nr:XRE family transcriptional regulator [Leifsonia sp. 115AMFTsu3.1]
MRAVHPEPSGAPVKIGAKLRASRLAQQITIDQLAASTGLSKGFISRVERDESSPSVATLVMICQALSLQIGALFEAADTALIELDDAPPINMGGAGTTDRLVTPRGQAALQMLRSAVNPGASGGQELYTINCEVEVLHVFKGTLTVVFVEEELSVGEGATLTFPGRVPHTWRNDGSEVAEVSWTMIPAAWSGSQ